MSLVGAGCSKNAATDPQAGGVAGGGAGRGRGGAGGGGAVPVVTAPVVVKAVPVTIPAVGTAEPVQTVQIRSQITGQLSATHFSEGQDVQKGALLFTIDPRPFQAALEQAQAVLARDTAQARNAQAEQSRYEDLFKRGLIPRDQYELQTANATALQATLASDQAQIENAQLNLQYTRITAPISGRTGTLGLHPGDLVRAMDVNPLVVINQVAPIYVTFSVPGRFLPDIRRYQAAAPLRVEATSQPGGAPGAPSSAPASLSPASPTASPTANATPGAPPAPGAAPAAFTETGTVTFIDNTVDPTTATIKLKGTFPNGPHELWPGLFVQVTLLLSVDPQAVVVPAVAVQASQSGQYVYVVKPDRTVELRNVTVQREQGDEMVIAKGLSGGEIVVTDGQLKLTPGAQVSTDSGGRPGGPGSNGGGRSGDGSRNGGAGGKGSPNGNGSGRRGGTRGNPL